jgi:hypothetical protein
LTVAKGDTDDLDFESAAVAPAFSPAAPDLLLVPLHR